eukprot:786997_1
MKDIQIEPKFTHANSGAEAEPYDGRDIKGINTGDEWYTRESIITALDLNWSDEDECIEQYESDIPNNDEKKEDNNNNNGEIAWFPTLKEDSNSNANKNEDMKYNKSFDIIRDNLGASRISIPYSLYLVCGTQSRIY